MSRQWPLGSEVKRKDLTGGAMLYDASRAGNAAPGWFDVSFWKDRGELDGEARGRGTVHFIRTAETKGFVLRHYRRGGLIAKVSRDRYWWRGEFETRAFREWQLLYHLHRAGLPVPAPVAARYFRHGATYTADLITERLVDSVSLAAMVRARGIPILGWIIIGRCIRMFHDLGVCHADLNAHNILLVGDDLVYLVDFDRGRLMKPGLWCDSNLVRLRRSLEKITYKLPPEHFSEADWHGLLDGYRQSAGASRPNAPLTAATAAAPKTQPIHVDAPPSREEASAAPAPSSPALPSAQKQPTDQTQPSTQLRPTDQTQASAPPARPTDQIQPSAPPAQPTHQAQSSAPHARPSAQPAPATHALAASPAPQPNTESPKSAVQLSLALPTKQSAS